VFKKILKLWGLFVQKVTYVNDVLLSKDKSTVMFLCKK